MSYNSFGRYFRITSFGESHGPVIGVVVDGVPPTLSLSQEGIQAQLDRRRPGASSFSSPRKEADRVTVLSGLLDGQTTGAPLCMVVSNRDVRSEDYDSLKDLFRPGHGDISWFMKYGIRDWRGGGRASGRETVARVAAGAVARQILAPLGVTILGHTLEVAGVRARSFVREVIENNALRCADPDQIEYMEEAILAAQQDGDSVGGVIEVRASAVPAGWGDPVYNKLDAQLAGALMGIGAVKAVEIGDGFTVTRMRGSEANDAITQEGFATNHAGGILGGISNGDEIVVRLAVKPTPSVQKPQQTVDTTGNPTVISIGGRHDPCIVPRMVPVAEAMVALVLVDNYLAQRAMAGLGT